MLEERGRIVGILERLTQVEMLERVGDGAYRLTDRGRATIEGIFGTARQALASAEAPEDKGAIAFSRWSDPGVGAAGVARSDQHIIDLLRFRDDVRLAAWEPYPVDGPAWEALTFIWREEAHSVDEPR